MLNSEFYAHLKTLLASHLGVYRRRDGSTVPAIVNLELNEVRDAEFVPEGLEVVIKRHPQYLPSGRLCGGVQDRKYWQVFLVQWPGQKTMEQAMQVLIQEFDDLQGYPSEPKTNALSQYTIRIPDLKYLLTQS